MIGKKDGPVFRILPGKLAIAAMTLWPIGIFTKKNATPCVIAHEQVHWKEQRNSFGLWYIPYAVIWLLLFVKNRRIPWYEHPMEYDGYMTQWMCERQST